MVNRPSIENALPGIQPVSVRYFRSNDTLRSIRVGTVLDYTILITEVLKSDTKQHAGKFVKLPYCFSLDIETVPSSLKSVISCREPMRENEN